MLGRLSSPLSGVGLHLLPTRATLQGEHFRAGPQNKLATGSGCVLYRCPPPHHHAPPRPLSSRGLSLAALPSSRSSLSPLSPESFLSSLLSLLGAETSPRTPLPNRASPAISSPVSGRSLCLGPVHVRSLRHSVGRGAENAGYGREYVLLPRIFRVPALSVYGGQRMFGRIRSRGCSGYYTWCQHCGHHSPGSCASEAVNVTSAPT